MATSTNSQISQEQLDKAHRIIESDGSVSYRVENSRGDVDDEGNIIEYVVRYLQGKGLTCTCKAGREGLNCWHKRAAFFHAKALRDERREQAAIESLVRQGVSREEAYAMIYANGHPAVHTDGQIKQAQYRNQPNAFSILR